MFTFISSMLGVGREQAVLKGGDVRSSSGGWRVELSRDWDVLGPFPQHAREQHFLSPSFPLNLAEPLDLSARFPSAYADGGEVGWATARSNQKGLLEVSFPAIRWNSIRGTDGWAGLQYHSVLRTAITVHPPVDVTTVEANEQPHLLVDILQGSFFTILPSGDSKDRSNPRWYAGNVYAMSRSPPHAVPLPTAPSLNSPTTYDLFVSGDYEIRLFGDPGPKKLPTLSITVSVDIEAGHVPDQAVTREPSHDIACDFVDGWAFGDALGVGVRSVGGWWSVEGASLSTSSNAIEVVLVHKARIAPTQTRTVAIRLTQKSSFEASEINLILHLTSPTSSVQLPITLPITQRKHWTLRSNPRSSSQVAIKASYLFANSMPTAFLAVPPEKENEGSPRPPLLALHGAGVETFEAPFWVDALPRQKHSWVLIPTGRTAWGMDWHGPSADDAWSTVSSLTGILSRHKAWHLWKLADNTKVVVLGHSNGGQGAWYAASRNPDRVVGVIPAAAYIKPQSYVPLVQSRYAHFIDPTMRAILESSFTADDNDLFLSNLVHTPILAIHGGDDENVPVWHTREAVAVVKTWNPHAPITYREDPGELHWYPTVFKNDTVQIFIDSVAESARNQAAYALPRDGSFTLTVSIPAESGSLHGWRILRLETPGRLANLTVTVGENTLTAHTSNVKAFSIHKPRVSLVNISRIVIDGHAVRVDTALKSDPCALHFCRVLGSWTIAPDSDATIIRPFGRIPRILSTCAPFTIVITDYSQHLLSAALRIAHNLNVYHKLDSEIIDEEEAVRRLKTGSVGEGNLVVVGKLDGPFSRTLLRRNQTPFALHRGSILLHGKPLPPSSSTALFLHPHPTNEAGLTLFIYAVEDTALEQGLRLFPFRTGITLPDFLVVESHAYSIGAGAVKAAGVWSDGWDWNDAMSSF